MKSSAAPAANPLPPESDSGLYRLLVDSVHDYAIFALDVDGHILTWNVGAQRLKGYIAAEAIGKHFSVFYSKDDRLARRPESLLLAASKNGSSHDEGWRYRKDGTRFWANIVITALHDDSGKLIGFAKLTRDLSERREANERALGDARRVAEAEGANRAKSDFLTAMSHELRTPLNAIGGYAELLVMGLGGPVTTEQSEFLDRIRRSQQHLLGIINDILNFSRIEAGQVSYDIQPVAVAEVANAVLPMVLPQATARLVELRQNVDPRVHVAADRGKLEQILLNLLSNAVKFTERGEIEVTAAEGNGWAGLHVRDTGVGIPAEKLGSIFEPFVQVGRSLTTPHEGTGLGLAISRDLARAMGGELVVESTLGAGTTFTIRLPTPA